MAPAVETLVKVSADYVQFEGVQFSHALPTYMQPYEVGTAFNKRLGSLLKHPHSIKPCLYSDLVQQETDSDDSAV